MTKTLDLILIKIGGSIVTNKSGLKLANLEIIKQLASEIHRAKQLKKCHIILSHGGGSFGHPEAKLYNTIAGLTDDVSRLGMAKVRQAMMELNKIIVDELINQGLPAVNLPPIAFLTSSDYQQDQIFLDALENLLNFDLLPVLHGDVITDSKYGCTIFSGELILNLLATKLSKKMFKPSLVIEVGDTEGVYDDQQRTIPIISAQNYNQIKQFLKGSNGVDVTGGMAHKVAEAYLLSKNGISTLIISSKQQNLYDAILGKSVTGTLIKSGT